MKGFRLLQHYLINPKLWSKRKKLKNRQKCIDKKRRKKIKAQSWRYREGEERRKRKEKNYNQFNYFMKLYVCVALFHPFLLFSSFLGERQTQRLEIWIKLYNGQSGTRQLQHTHTCPNMCMLIWCRKIKKTPPAAILLFHLYRFQSSLLDWVPKVTCDTWQSRRTEELENWRTEEPFSENDSSSLHVTVAQRNRFSWIASRNEVKRLHFTGSSFDFESVSISVSVSRSPVKQSIAIESG